jgi:glycosyltransferase involved in cell wall biosynthesis
MKKKIVIDARMIDASGIGTYLNNLIPRFFDKADQFEFCLLGERQKIGKKEWITDKIQIIDFPAPIYSIQEQIQFKKVIPDDCDLFFAPHYNIPYFYSGRLITTIHDVFHLAKENENKTILKTLYARMMLRAALKKSTAVMTVSNFSLEEMKKYNLPDIDKVTVVYNGVRQTDRNDLSRTTNSPEYILYVGNVKPHKNLKHLVGACITLYEQGKIDIKLIIVGQIDKFITGIPGFKENIAASKWNSRFIFTGRIDNNLLEKYYREALMLVHPSYYEGFGLPPLEAMATGTPCLVSKAASLPEICGNAALYCDPLDTDDIAKKIYRMITDPELRKRLTARGYQQIKKFDWDKTAENCISIFKNILR